MNTARIAELLESFLSARIAAQEACHSEPAKAREDSALLSPTQLHDISTYIDILIRWNARINLTAVRDPDEIVIRHFGESLFAARNLFPVRVHAGAAAPKQSGTDGSGECSSVAVTLADLGSGAGFPGLPIKLWAPHISLSLIESHHKKATFLREVTRALTLTNVDIQNARAETLTGKSFDVVTLRAVERFQSILPVAAALVRPAGRLALLIGASQQNEARATLPEFTWSDPVAVPSSKTRILLIGREMGTYSITSGA